MEAGISMILRTAVFLLFLGMLGCQTAPVTSQRTTKADMLSSAADAAEVAIDESTDDEAAGAAGDEVESSDASGLCQASLESDEQPMQRRERVAAPQLEAPRTLGELQDLALAHNPTLSLATAEIEKERGMWEQVGLYPNPTLGFLNSSTSSGGNTQSNGLLVQQTIITAQKLEKARATEAYGFARCEWQYEAQRLRILNDVRLRYYDVLAAQEQIRIATELAELSQRALEAAQALLEGMQAPVTDVLQAEVQREKVDVALQNARIEYESAWRKLAVVVGCPNLAPVPLVEPDEHLPDYDLEGEWQRLLAESPQLKAVEAEVGIAYRQWISAEAAPIPDVTVQFVSQYDSIGQYGTFNSLVAIPLPIHNRNQGGIYNASQEYVRSQKEVERVSLVLRDQLVTSFGEYEAAKNQAERLKADVLPRLRENLELTLNGYRHGQYNILAVLNAQETTLQSSFDYIAALTRARRLSVDIEGLQLKGGLNPATIGTAIQELGAGSRLQAVKAQMERQSRANLSNFAPSALD